MCVCVCVCAAVTAGTVLVFCCLIEDVSFLNGDVIRPQTIKDGRFVRDSSLIGVNGAAGLVFLFVWMGEEALFLQKGVGLARRRRERPGRANRHDPPTDQANIFLPSGTRPLTFGIISALIFILCYVKHNTTLNILT